MNDVNTLCSSIGAKYLISVIDPGYAPETPKCVNNHLKLGFDDILEVNNSNKIFRNRRKLRRKRPNLTKNRVTNNPTTKIS